MVTKRRLSVTTGALALAGALGLTVSAPAVADAPHGSAATNPVGSNAHCADEPLMMGYYRTWRDVTVPHDANSSLPYENVISMDDLPEGLDVAMVFDAGDTENTDYWQTLRQEYVPALHEQGTRVVYTLWIDDLAQADIPLTESAYRAYAQHLVNTYVTAYGLDGLDIDVESYPKGEGLTRAIGIIDALGELIGPNSGTDRLFIYDTNQTGDTPLFRAVSENFSYVLLQAYGRDVDSLDGTWSTFADEIDPCKFLVGFSFPEEQSPTHWDDADGAYNFGRFLNSRARAYAMWQPEDGHKGGIFAYAIDRDGKAYGDDTITMTDFEWTKALLELQDVMAENGVPDNPMPPINPPGH